MSGTLSAAASAFEPRAVVPTALDTISSSDSILPVKKKKTKEERGPRKRHPKKKVGVPQGLCDTESEINYPDAVLYGSPFSLSSSFLLSSSLFSQAPLSSVLPNASTVDSFLVGGHWHGHPHPHPHAHAHGGPSLVTDAFLFSPQSQDLLSDLYAELSLNSDSSQLTLDDMERRKWSQWAIYSAEVERNRRISLLRAIDEEQDREREHRGKLAIALMERERLTRVSSQFANDIASTSWFNDTFLSSFQSDYEVICPFHNRGCQECFQRSSLASHLEECSYAVEIQAHGSNPNSNSNPNAPCAPVDIEPSSSEHLDRNYEVMCPNSSLGCRHICNLDDIHAHLATCLYSGYISTEQQEIERNITRQLVIGECEGERDRRVSESSNSSVNTSSTKLLSLHRLLNLQRQQLLSRLYAQVHAHYELRQKYFETNVKPGVDALVDAIKSRLESSWVHPVQVEAYGSCVTGCSGPSDDVDLVVCLDDETYSSLLSIYGVVPVLYQLEEHIRRKMDDLLTITDTFTQTKIPIIKAVAMYAVPGADDQYRSVNVDISIQGHGHMGLAAAELISSLATALVPFRPIACLLKEHFKAHELCDVYNGGIPSYGVLIMALLPVLQYLRIYRQSGEKCEEGQQERHGKEETLQSETHLIESVFELEKDTRRPPPFPPSISCLGSGPSQQLNPKTTRRRLSGGSISSAVEASLPPAPVSLVYSPSRAIPGNRLRSSSASSISTNASSSSKNGQGRRRGYSSARKHSSQFPRSVTFNNVLKRREYGRLVAIRLLELDETNKDYLDLSKPLPILLTDQDDESISEETEKEAGPGLVGLGGHSSGISYGIIISDILSMYGELLEPGKHGYSARHAGFRFDLTSVVTVSVSCSPERDTCGAAEHYTRKSSSSSDTSDSSRASAGSLLITTPGVQAEFESKPIFQSEDSSEPNRPRLESVSRQCTVEHPQIHDPLIIEDPIDGINNIAKNCYKALAIQRCVMEAHERLKSIYVRGLRGGSASGGPVSVTERRASSVKINQSRRNSNPVCNAERCNKCILSEVFGVCYKKV